MNKAELKALIYGKDVDRAIDVLAHLSEAERKGLASDALLLNKYALASMRHYEDAHPISISFRGRLIGGGAIPRDLLDPLGHEITKLVILATCSFSEIKKTGYIGVPEAEGSELVLMARKPEWLTSWCEFVLEVAPASHWSLVYKLEKAFGLALAHDTLYLAAMSAALGNSPDMMEIILNESEICNEFIWNMFSDPVCLEFLSNPEQILVYDSSPTMKIANSFRYKHQTFSRDVTNNWLRCVKELLTRGVLSREKARAVAFTALVSCADDEGRKSKHATADSTIVSRENELITRKWQNQTDFSIALCKVCFDENSSEQGREFASLSGAKNSKVSQYALEKLMQMPVRELPVDVILSNIPRAFQSKKKTPANHALRLLEILLKSESSNKRQVAEAIMSALDHKSPDIHKRALSLLEQSFEEVPNWLGQSLESRMANLKGLNRELAVSLRSRINLPESTLNKNTSENLLYIQVLDNDILLLERAARSKSSRLAPLVDLDDAISSFDQARLPDLRSASLWSYDFPRLDPDKRVERIDKEDDLIFLLAKLLEGFASPLEEELVMDGVSGLCASHSEHFAEKTFILQQKIDRSLGANENHFKDAVRPWHQLIRSYLQVTVGEGHWTYDFFLDQRIDELCYRVERSLAAPLLALPTHEDGWLSPDALVERLLIWQNLGLELARAELTQALLRLAPEGRAEALAKAKALTGLPGEVVRYALGGNDFNPEHKFGLWIAAFRAREPFGDNQKLSELLPGMPPDGPIAASYSLDRDQLKAASELGYNHELPNILPVQSFDPDFPRKRAGGLSAIGNATESREIRYKYSLLPTCLLHDNAIPFAPGLRPYVWPQNRESFLAILAKRVINRDRHISEAAVSLLFNPDQPMTGNGKWWLCRALSSTDERIAGLAIDLLIACISENRIEPASISETLNALMIAEQIKLGQVTTAFRRASKTSALHAFFIWEAVTGFLDIEFPSSIPARLQWLEFLVDLKREFGFELSSQFKAKLKELSSGGKTKKICDLLLSHDGEIAKSLRKAVARQVLENKLARLERWSLWMVR